MKPRSHLFKLFLQSAFAMAAFTAVFMAAAPAHAEDNDTVGLGGFGSVKGSGKLQTENRAVAGFRAIALRGSMKLVLRQGTREGVQLSGDDNILPLVETKVIDQNGVPTLDISVKRGTSLTTRHPIVATIDLTTLSALSIRGSGDVSGEMLKTPSFALSISGSGDVKLKQLSADDVSVKISGSGDVELAGRTTKLAVSIAGSGDFDSRALGADDVRISVAGNGDAEVNARKSLDVSISGNGDVSYTGDPVVRSSIGGHGSVKKQ